LEKEIKVIKEKMEVL